MGRPLSYEPDSTHSIAATAAREKRDPREVVYDLMLVQNGRSFLMYAAFGYADGNADCLRELIWTRLRSWVAVMPVPMCGKS